MMRKLALKKHYDKELLAAMEEAEALVKDPKANMVRILIYLRNKK